MLTLVVVEGIVILLLVVLVAGLLRSHADILRTLDRLGATEEGVASTARQPMGLGPTRRAAGPVAATSVGGTQLDGTSRTVALTESRGLVLLAFLSSGCSTCRPFWRSFDRDLELPHSDIRPVIVTKDATEESAAELAALAPSGVPVILSSEAWDAFRVPGTPYFQLVDAAGGTVLGEGSAANWSRLMEMIRRSVTDEHAAPDMRRSTADRLLDTDEELRRAGIRPGDESLHRAPTEERP